MARYAIDKAGTRKKLEPRREPYWGAPIDRGLFLGFRKLEAGGSWVGRFHDDEGKHRYKSLGHADAMPHDEAVKAARAWAKQLDDGVDTSKVQTVADACREYVEDRRREKGDSVADDNDARFRRYVYGHSIAETKLTKLRTSHLKDWRAGLPMQPVSSNRYLTAIKAALNHAVAARYIHPGKAIEWQQVKPHETNARRDLYLDREQRAKLIDALPDHTKPFMTALSLLPVRPGALAQCTVGDLKGESLYIRHDKAGAGRTIALSPAAADLLREQAQGKLPGAPLVSFADGSHWYKDRWSQIVSRAAKHSGLPKGTCAYTFRHSVITDMLTGGMDSMTVARMAGTSLAMIEKHYGHLLHQHAADSMEALGL